MAKAMREMGLKSCVSKRFKPTTQADSDKTPAPNLLDQKLTATTPNQKWLTDITYLSTADGWVYLAVVVDLFSRTGCCYDNAVMERFSRSLKHEWTNRAEFADIEEARMSVFQYIETFYNTDRLHQTVGHLTPNQFEALHQASLAV